LDKEFETALAEAYARTHVGRYAESEHFAEAALARAKALGSVGLEVRASRSLARALAARGDLRGAIDRLAGVLAMLPQDGRGSPFGEPAVTEAAFAICLDWVELTGVAGAAPPAQRLEVLERAEVLARQAVRPEWQSALLGTRGAILRSQGRSKEAADLLRAAVLAFLPGSTTYTLASYRQPYGDVLFELGQVESAEVQYLAILMEPASSTRDKKSANVGLARCALKRGAHADAIGYAEKAVVTARALGDEASCNALGVLADALQAAGEHEHAVAVAHQLIDRARRTGNKVRLFHALRAHVDVSMGGDREAALASLEEAQTLAEELDRPSGRDRFMAQVRTRRQRLTGSTG